jgi:hypothetical protein
MSDSSENPIIVTAQERAHPALRKLARACIALGRLHHRAPDAASATAPIPVDNGEQGQRHD